MQFSLSREREELFIRHVLPEKIREAFRELEVVHLLLFRGRIRLHEEAPIKKCGRHQQSFEFLLQRSDESLSGFALKVFENVGDMFFGDIATQGSWDEISNQLFC